MKAFIIAENADAAAKLCAGARTMADEVVLVAIDMEPPASCADKVLKVAIPNGAVFDDAYATVIPAIDGEIVIAEATRRVKSVVGRLAAAKGAAAITDALSIEDGVAESRYFGGLAMRKLKAVGGLSIYTMSPAVFGELEPSGGNEIVELEWIAPKVSVRLVSCKAIEKSGIDLAKCDIVVAAGRGFTEKAQIEQAQEICVKIDAGLGCTRPLTECSDLMPRGTYIGVSGLMLTPKVYLGIGVSGQAQHTVGIDGSGIVFAVNKDKNAPIFKLCDYGLVGDLNVVLPALSSAL